MSASAELLPPEQPEKKSKAIAKRAKTALLMPPPREPEQPSMEQVLMKAVEQGASIETLERIAAMIEKAQAGAARREFFAALCRFQEAMPVIKKHKKVLNKDRQTTRFHYAPIEDILPVARPHLAANGLSVSTDGRLEADKYVGIANAHHTGGHTETREFPVPVVMSEFMSNQQSYAAASTFAERYAVRKVLGIVTADDDNESRLTPQEAREIKARQPVNQPRQTPTAQKANGATNGAQRPDLEPAGEGEAIDAATVKGLTAAMEHAALGNEDFKKRFPKLAGLEQVSKAGSRVVMSWIADPVRK